MTKNIWAPPDLDEFTHASIQALEKGTATERQQQQALKWIVETLCMTYYDTAHDNDRIERHNQGRRWVGLSIVQALKLNIDWVKKQREKVTKNDRPTTRRTTTDR